MLPITPTFNDLPEHLGDFTDALKHFIAQTSPQATISVAFSGGLDSTVLLHLFSQHPLAQVLKGRLYAHYIDHGLQAVSLEWKAHCHQTCMRLNVPFEFTAVTIEETQRKGIEAVARKRRYQALAQRLTAADDILVTGHHQRDQAETVLLNLARGSGVVGLAAMPYEKKLSHKLGSVRHLRPLLTIAYKKLVAYADYFQLDWVEDPTNSALDFKRNAVRHEVLPALQAQWPNCETTIARSAQNLSEALLLLDRMADRVLRRHTVNRYFLDLKLFDDLDWIEQKNIIRRWFSKKGVQPLSAKHYGWIQSVLVAKSVSRNSAFSYQTSSGELAFYQSKLYYLTGSAQPFIGGLVDFLQAAAFEDVATTRSASKAEGQIESREMQGESLKLSSQDDHRHGGFYELNLPKECYSKLHLIHVRPLSQEDDLNRKKLKTYFQKIAIPVWERAVWPGLFLNGKLIAVLGCANCLQRLDMAKTVSTVALDQQATSSGYIKIKVSKLLFWQLIGLLN